MLGSGPGSGRMAAALAWLALAGYQYWTADGGGRPTADGGGSGRRTAAAWAGPSDRAARERFEKKKKNLTIFMKQQVFNRKLFKHMVKSIENTMVFHTNVEKP